MLIGRRYRLKLDTEQAAYAERVANICRAVWNVGLEQRRAAAELNRHMTDERMRWPTYASQCRELAEAKRTEGWLSEAPSHCLQQTLRDLDRACRQHGVWRVHWRSKRWWRGSFRFPDPTQIGEPIRLNRRWGELRLPKLGRVRFRWSRALGGTIRNATVLQEGDQWFVSLCVDEGRRETMPNGLPPVGIDRGVVIAVATSDGQCLSFAGVRGGEQQRMKRLQQQLARQQKGSHRRRATRRAIGRVLERVRHRRMDFAQQTAHQLTTDHGLVVIEDLRVQAMTRSARGSVEQPGRNVAQKAGLNRAILDKVWGSLRRALEWQGNKNGCAVMGVAAAYTSQTCSACGYTAAESRESQADFRCVSCGYKDNADVNAAKNILAAGLAVTGRGDLGVARSVKRQPPEQVLAGAAA